MHCICIQVNPIKAKLVDVVPNLIVGMDNIIASTVRVELLAIPNYAAYELFSMMCLIHIQYLMS